MSTVVPSHRILDREIRLVKALGAGSFGEVHLAEMIPGRSHFTYPFPERVAIKIIQSRLCDPDQAVSLLTELNILKRMCHPCIVGYIALWRERSSRCKYANCYCLAMNYCDGGDLAVLMRDYMKRKATVPQEVVTRLMACVFAGLNYSHANRVIHRDIKPANVFLTRVANGSPQGVDGHVGCALIGDYGLARPLDKTMRLVKTRVGTPSYCSPEIVAGELYGNKTDIFSAGVMFYELMAQESPFWKHSFTDVICFHRILHHDPLPRFRHICNGRYSESLVRLVCSCLSKTEPLRPTAYEVLTAFTSRIPRQLDEMKVPLYVESGAAAAAAAAVAGAAAAERGCGEAAPAAAESAAESDSASAVAAASPPGRSPSPTAARKRCGSPAVAAPTAPAPAARLAALLKSEFKTAVDARLEAAVKGNVELFLLLKVILVTRGARNGESAAATSDTLQSALVTFLQSTSTDTLDISSVLALVRAGCCG